MLRGPFFIALVLAPTCALAQAKDEEIVVTGRGLEAGLGEQAYDTKTIGRERLDGSASNRLEDILRDVAGFQNFRRSDARSANPTSQGISLRELGGNASSRALLVLDGVPQSDPFGGWVFWPAYDPRRLGQVRVVRGGGSGIYGPGALAGTIELESASPAELNGGIAELAYGSRDSVDAFAGFGMKLDPAYVSLSGAYARGDGFIPVIASQRGPVDRPSPYVQGSVAARALAPISGNVELQASGLWFTDHRQRGTAFSAIATDGFDASLRLVGRGSWRWSALAYYQDRSFYNSFATVNAARTTVSRSAEQYDVPSHGMGARIELRPPLREGLELRLGADWRRTEGETRELFSFLNNVGRNGRLAGGENQTAGAFMEGSWDQHGLVLTAAGRLDRWWMQDGFLNEKVLASGFVLNNIRYPDRSGWRPTGRAGLAYHPSNSLTLRSAAYLGWRLPTLNELYRPFRVGADLTNANAALKPERLKGVEAGLDFQPISAVRLGATVFANRLEDAIANVTIIAGPPKTSQRQNVDAIAARGIELEGEVTLGPVRLAASYTHVDTKVHAGGIAAPLDGRRPAQTPRDSFSATASWQAPAGIRASLTGRYVGAQFEDDLGTQKLADALTFDATLAVPVAKRISLEARAENLTDKQVIAGISGAGIIERATPRTIWIGLRLH
jgi:outer membrane receptor protein involved in Fe transport